MDRVPLGEVVELAYGASLPKRARRIGSVPVYGSNGITGWHDEPLVQEPTIIVGRKGSAGAVHLVRGPSYPIDTTYFVRPRGGRQADLGYLYYVLSALDLSRLAISTGVPGLNREDAYRELLPFPSIDQQRRIVDLLDRATGLKRLAEEAQAKARELIPALFLDMFGNGSDGRWPQVQFGVLVGESQLGLVRAAAEMGEDRSFPYVRMNAITNDASLNLRELKRVDASEDEVARYSLRSGDFLFNTRNSRELVGKVAVFDAEGTYLFNNNIMRIRFVEEADPTFIATAFATAPVQRELELRKSGTTSVFAIYYKNLRTLPLPAPPIGLQRKFAERVREITSIRAAAEQAARSAERTTAAIMDRLLAS